MNLSPTSTTRLDVVPRRSLGHSWLRRAGTWAIVAFLTLLTLLVLSITGFFVYGLQYSERVYEGTMMAGVDVGGMSRPEVAAVMDQRFADFADIPVVFTDGNQTFEIPVTELGVTLEADSTVDRAMAFGRDGSWWERSIDWADGLLNGQELSPVIAVDDAQFRLAMESLAPEVISLPTDAQIVIGDDATAELVEDTDGRNLNVVATRERVVRELGELGQEPVALALVTVPATVQTADVEGGLPAAERAVGQAFTVQSAEGTWGLTRSRLSALVSVDSTGQVMVDQDGVRAFVTTIAEQVDREAVDAGITVDDEGALIAVPQVDAATVDIDGSAASLTSAIVAGDGEVELVVARSEPAISTESAEEWVARAEALIGDGVDLAWTGGSSQLGRADLLYALVITPQPEADEQFALTFDELVVAELLAPLQEDLTIPMENARFRLVDGSIRYVAEAREGREVDIDASVAAIVQAVEGGEGSAELAISVIEPDYTASDRGSISLPDVLGESQTYYGNSSDPRRHNVERASELEDGWLIPPDGVFSYAEIMGLVDEQNGFVTGFGIVADEGGGVTTAPVIGGGICQVSTTIFQAAFWAGLPIEERWQHPYWLVGYGQAPYGMAGLDAMVNIEPDWALDLKFRNTTGNWIALVLEADGENVHAEIRGVNPGWTITVPEPAITNVVQPEKGMIYTDSPELPKGQELQVETAREGFTSTITRTVTDGDGNVIEEFEMESTYSASRDRTLRGTGGA
ncbi:MAG TPA: peptidoglycan binding domain-containing protein [Thermomicrobiales bacterium]|nr:peptidoglycan binding domain-containing protein [Thermomicrobiales bacterium]